MDKKFLGILLGLALLMMICVVGCGSSLIGGAYKKTCMAVGEECQKGPSSDTSILPCCSPSYCETASNTNIGKCTKMVCKDTDGGLNYYVKGTTSTQVRSVTDTCAYCLNTDKPCKAGDSGCSEICVLEAYCANSYRMLTRLVKCVNGCKNGACT